MSGTSTENQHQTVSQSRARHGACEVEAHRGQLREIGPAALAEYASELLGLDIQAVILARSRSNRSGGLQAWELMTPYGSFWLVEDGAVAEMFMVASGRARHHPESVAGISQAMERYRELHMACGARDARTGAIR